jgi:hypothetical protein
MLRLCESDAMQAKAIASKGGNRTVVSKQQHRGGTYRKVLDQRKRPIRGLWKRNKRYYAQITVEDSTTGRKEVRRVPLEGAATNAQAVAKFQEVLTQRRKGALPVLKLTPRFTDYAEQYFKYYEQVKDAKRESTLYTERIAVNHWIEHLGITSGCWRIAGRACRRLFG